MKRLIAAAVMGLGTSQPGWAASDLAWHALEEFRTDKDRELSRLNVPPESSAEALPQKAEVYLIEGYINYDCLRYTWKDGRVLAQKVAMTRSWFYSPKESYTAEQWEVSGEEFQKAWRAFSLIRAATMQVNQVPSKDLKSFTENWSISSHEKTFYISLSAGDESKHLEWSVRGHSFHNGLSSFDEVQTRGGYKVFRTLVSEESAGTPFALAEWGPFQTRLLEQADTLIKLHPERFPLEKSLITETALRLLGEMGYAPALPVIARVLTEAELVPPGANWKENIQREARLARDKIAFQVAFDPRRAEQAIRENKRGNNPDRDFVLWMRNRYFQNDPKSYLAMLSADLKDPAAREAVLLESVEDLKSKYPDEAKNVFPGLLDHSSSEVAVKAAMALLEQDRSNEAALKALTRIASDPKASIPDRSHSFEYYGRERAIDYLASSRSAAPEGFRWDAARVRKQLEVPGEDGRVVYKLLASLTDLEKRPLTDQESLKAYRRALEGERNLGTLDACEFLIKLKDKESGPAIQRLLEEVGKDCNHDLSWKEDHTAKYPWTDRYEIERLSDELKKMLAE